MRSWVCSQCSSSWPETACEHMAQPPGTESVTMPEPGDGNRGVTAGPDPSRGRPLCEPARDAVRSARGWWARLAPNRPRIETCFELLPFPCHFLLTGPFCELPNWRSQSFPRPVRRAI